MRIKCGKCDYVCSLNIQLKKHKNLKHADDCCEQCNYIIENLVYAGMKASQDADVAKDIKAMKENKKNEDVPAVDNKDVNKAKKKAKNRNENGKENSPRQ